MSKRAVAWVVAVGSLCALLGAAPGCDGGRTPSSPSAGREQLTVKLTTAHFEIRADHAPSDLLTLVAGQLEANYDRITSDLRVASLAMTSIWVWQDSDSFYADMGTRGEVYYGAGGYVVNAHTVSMLVVPASAAEVGREAVHEFAHIASMAVNASIPNNPRWLWETVAQYESGSYVDPTRLEYMRAGRYPSIADLDAAWNTSSQVYQVGYVLGEFIVGRWGQDGLVRLIRLNGDIPGALGVATAELEMAQLAGSRLSRGYTIAFVGTWGAAAVAISAGGAMYGDSPPPALALAATLVVFVLKTCLTYGWILYALLATRRTNDALERAGLRRFALLQGAGFLAFDLAIRDVTRHIGLHTGDVGISLVQVAANYPALWWMWRFLERRAVSRPADPLPANMKADLVALGLSAREADVVELLLAGLSHKEIGERLFIAPDTVKKHTYNAHRKLGVQNRVQLSYFVQNRLPRRS